MSKMRKEYDPNKVKRRKRKPIVSVYIICEGKETRDTLFQTFSFTKLPGGYYSNSIKT